MDRKTIYGFGLLVALIVLWGIWANQNQKNPATPAADTTRNAARNNAARPDTTRQADSLQAAATVPDTTRQDSASVAQRHTAELRERYGVFAPAAEGTSQTILVETDRATFYLDTKGGRPTQVLLKQFTDEHGKPLPVWSANSANQFGFLLRSKEAAGKMVNTENLYFTPVVPEGIRVSGNQQKTLVLRADLGSGKYVEQRYTFTGDRYDVRHTLVLAGLGGDITDNSIGFIAQEDLPQTERSYENMRVKSTVIYSSYEEDPSDGEVSEISATSSDEETERPSTSLRWVAFKSQFFSTAFISNDRFNSALLTTKPMPRTQAVKRLSSQLTLPYHHAQVDTIGMRLYFGPNDLSVLRPYHNKLDHLVDLGWGPLRYINMGIHYVFMGLGSFISNFGIIILILSILIKALLLPLTFRSYISQAKMKVVSKMPEVAEINEKYKDDPAKLQQKRMAFYTQVGVSPLGGCLPMLLQLPFMIAMFMFFPNSIELRHQPFLWASDLSTYDTFLHWGTDVWPLGDHLSLFALLWVLSQFVMAWVQQRTQGDQPGAPAMMKWLPYFMPVIFFGLFNSYSSGLSYYLLISNLITFGQNQFLSAFVVKEDAIRQQIHDYREGKGKRKAGGLTGWMQRMQAQREEMAAERQAQMQGRTGRRALEQQRSKQQGGGKQGNLGKGGRPPKKRK